MKTDANGNELWNKTYGGSGWDTFWFMTQTNDKGCILIGSSASFGASHDYWLVKLASEEIQATIDVDPNSLNLKSKGEWITAYVELPEGYAVNEIDVSTVMLNDTVPAEMHPTEVGDFDNDGVPDLMVKFDRASIIDCLENNMDWSNPERTKPLTYLVTLTVTGSLHDGTHFEGSDTIRVLKFLKGDPKLK